MLTNTENSNEENEIKENMNNFKKINFKGIRFRWLFIISISFALIYHILEYSIYKIRLKYVPITDLDTYADPYKFYFNLVVYLAIFIFLIIVGFFMSRRVSEKKVIQGGLSGILFMMFLSFVQFLSLPDTYLESIFPIIAPTSLITLLFGLTIYSIIIGFPFGAIGAYTEKKISESKKKKSKSTKKSRATFDCNQLKVNRF